MGKITPQLDYLNGIDRYRFLTILNAADKCEEYQFSKQATFIWLVNYPGDLFVQYHQAMTYIHLGKIQHAITILENLSKQDPLFIEPVQALSKYATSSNEQKQYKAITQYLTQENPPDNILMSWLAPLWDARKAFSRGNFNTTMALVHQSMVNQPPVAIPAILHLKTAYKIEDQEMLNNLCDIYYEKWPKCLQINIIKAISEIEQGEESSAVERLHWAAAHDSAGQVIQRLMGPKNRFQNLWPDQLTIYFDLPIPASVTSYLGWNQLQDGIYDFPDIKQKSSSVVGAKEMDDEITQKIHLTNRLPSDQKEDPKNTPAAKELKESNEVTPKWATEEDFQEIQKVFSNLAKRLKKPDLDRTENRFPVYVVIASHNQLESLYGPNTATYIDELLRELVSAIQKMPDWGSILFYPDNPAQMSQWGLKPIDARDAWQTKLALSDLDSKLEEQGEMIGALLIIGGPEIVPYHHLPNPTQDNDIDVPSDNPYATVDENYFIPQWPVGRLPGEAGSDSGLLLQQIRQLIYQYQHRSKKHKPFQLGINTIKNNILRLINHLGLNFLQNQTLGYSAEIWQQASADVYKTIGSVKDLHLSPPTHSKTLKLYNKINKRLGYFNLHGIKEGPHWYGQKDFSSNSHEPDYPIALSPDLLCKRTPSLKLILSEACYGANIINKAHEDALSLKFLDSGTTTFIGSTCIAYGSITPPLIAADYLADVFWRNVISKKPAGYALMQAKLSLAEEMTRTQGFLDGEDQKTILSFVLFGDPLAVYDDVNSMPRPLLRSKTHPAVRTISDSDMEHDLLQTDLPKSVNKQVKKTMEKYLPGLKNAQMHLNKSSGFNSSSMSKSVGSEQYVVTLQKSFDQNQSAKHYHFARMTFDRKGKLVKISTSR